MAKIVEQYVKKGSKLYVEGALQTRKWTDQSGAEKYSTEVVLQTFNGSLTLLDSPNNNSKPASAEPQNDFERGDQSKKETTFSPGYFDRAMDDEIPF